MVTSYASVLIPDFFPPKSMIRFGNIIYLSPVVYGNVNLALLWRRKLGNYVKEGHRQRAKLPETLGELRRMVIAKDAILLALMPGQTLEEFPDPVEDKFTRHKPLKRRFLSAIALDSDRVVCVLWHWEHAKTECTLTPLWRLEERIGYSEQIIAGPRHTALPQHDV